MRISRIFTESQLKTQQTVNLDSRSSHYVSTVLRLKLGSEVILFNNDGFQYRAVIHAIEKKIVTVFVQYCENISNESDLQIHLAIAVSKGDRMDWVVQKATELGVTSITPLRSERTTIKLNAERLEKKRRHWHQIIISASEQCGRNTLVQLSHLQVFDDWITTVEADKKVILHHQSEYQLRATEATSSVALLIGPEGGFSEEEITRAKSQQFYSLRLGPRVMRTETAPLAAIAILQSLWGDM